LSVTWSRVAPGTGPFWVGHTGYDSDTDTLVWWDGTTVRQLLSGAVCRLYKTTGATLSPDVVYTIPFNAHTIDTAEFHDDATNNSRITVPAGYAGKYLITGSVLATPSLNSTLGGDYATLYLTKNGGSLSPSFNAQSTRLNTAGSWASLQFTEVLDLAELDYIEHNVVITTNAGVDYAWTLSTSSRPMFSAVKL
jgi:hypothetical protein